jgi:hypothetical protein
MVEVFEGLAAFIHGDNLGFTKAVRCLMCTDASPSERPTHTGNDVPKEGLNFVVDHGAGVARLGY